MTPTWPPMAFELETERLTLRLRDVQDVELLLRLHDERRSDPSPRRPWVPWDRDTVTGRLLAQRATAREQGFGLLTITRRVEGDTIGYCGLIVGRVGAHEPEIAYEVLQSAHGHGYATEAARAVADAGLATGRARLWATIRPWNAPSLAVVRRLGFVRDSDYEDEYGASVLNRLDGSASSVGAAPISRRRDAGSR